MGFEEAHHPQNKKRLLKKEVFIKLERASNHKLTAAPVNFGAEGVVLLKF